MKKVLIIYALLIAAIAGWWLVAEKAWQRDDDNGAKEKALAVSKHSRAFNRSVEAIMDHYYKISLNFSNADIIAANENANKIKAQLAELNLDELKKDTAGIYETAISRLEDTKGSLQQMIDDPTLDAKRQSFNTVSDNLFGLLNTIHYDSGELYWIECPIAFGEGSPGFWL